MSGEGDAHGLLVVGDCPGITEDRIGRPFSGDAGRYLRDFLLRHWQGPMAFDTAVRCAPGREKVTMEHVSACRGYLACTVNECKPKMVFAMGTHAIAGMTGRALPTTSVRRGYAWMGDVPVWFFSNPTVALRNRFYRRCLEEDMAYALLNNPPAPRVFFGTELLEIEDAEDAQEAYDALKGIPGVEIAFDCETAGAMWRKFQVLCVALSAVDQRLTYVWGPGAMKNKGARAVLCKILRDESLPKVGSNVKYDQLALELECGSLVRGVVGDTRLLRKLLDTDADGDLETMAELVGLGGHKEEAQIALSDATKNLRKIVRGESTALSGFLRPDVLADVRGGDRPAMFAYGLLPHDILVRYCARDALTTGILHKVLSKSLWDEPSLFSVYHEIVMPAADAMKCVESWGVPVDKGAVDQFISYLAIKRDALWARLEPYNFNPSSTKQVSTLLFDTLKLKPLRKTTTGKFSTDEATLEALRGKHSVVDDLLEWRKVLKLDGTYATGMLAHIRDDGRIHPTILLDGARSGRTSSRDPNMQNIPKEAETEESKMARNCFAAPLGSTLVSIDYSQLELRIAAMLSQDPAMCEIFQSGVDFHQRTAELIAPMMWGIKAEDVQKHHRKTAKTVNFGLLYGQGDIALAEKIGCSMDEAAKVRAAILGKFSTLKRWIATRLGDARKTGYCWTWWDGEDARRRNLFTIGDMGDDNSARRHNAENGAHNSPIQGTGSDFLLASLAATVKWIVDEGIPAKVVLPIHDALLLEVEEDYVDEVVRVVSGIMVSWPCPNVPLVVDTEVGRAWGAMEKYGK